MKEFLKDNIFEIITIILMISLMVILCNMIENRSKERLAIINNKKENVIKFSNCEHIEEYYYCYHD